MYRCLETSASFISKSDRSIWFGGIAYFVGEKEAGDVEALPVADNIEAEDKDAELLAEIEQLFADLTHYS